MASGFGLWGGPGSKNVEWLVLAFALGMTAGTGIKTGFDSSVFAASAGAFLLAATAPARADATRHDASAPRSN